jgi:D-alanyl-D-alanine carboxypeptidase
LATLRGQFARIFLFLFIATAIAAISAMPTRAAPFAAHVMDARTGETLYSKNADTRLHPASLTKMLTLYIVFDAIQRGEISLDTMVTVSKNAASKPPSRLGLKTGQRIALRHLIRAAAIKSANDAASAIGDALSGNEEKFAKRMNRTAKSLGMKNSTFKNANGLTQAGHLSTARDMSILGRRLFYDFPQYYNIFSRRETDAGVADVANTNRRFLDGYKGADGIKTGYTVAAGFNLTASAERGKVRIIATVFGGSSTAARNAKVAELLDLGFSKAPADARTRKPAPVELPADDPALVAEAAPPDMDDGTGVGKTIRLVTTLTKSPRPRARGEGGAQLAAAASTDATAAAAVVMSLQDTINDAVAAAAEPEPLPFTVVDADGQPVQPKARPPLELAEAAPAPADAAPVAADEAVAEVLPVPETAPDPVEEAPVEMASVAPEAPLPFAMANPADELALGPTRGIVFPADMADAAQPVVEEPVELAMAAPLPVLRPLPQDTADAEAEPEVIVRMSTSGGRNWGVVLGQHASRALAERTLMKAGLSESMALGEGLRKVVPRGGGYDATVLGLTQEQADLACRRLTARAQDCITIGP